MQDSIDYENLKHELQHFEPKSSAKDTVTPPASWYIDPGFLQLEKDSLFSKHWLYAGHSSEIQKPGDYLTGEIFGRPYLVVMNREKEIKAFSNTCLHHGTCVARGKGNSRVFVCPYHAWNYNVNGELTRTPGAQIPKTLKDKGLRELPLRRVGPFLVIHFGNGEGLSPLEEMMSAFDFSEYQFVVQKSYDLDCNWKVFVDNYLDGGYHVPHMHPELTQFLDLKTYKTEVFDNYSIQSCGAGTERLEGGALYGWAYPNFMINQYGKWVDTNWALPISVNKTRVVFDYYYKGDVNEDIKLQSLKESNQVQDEDEEVCHLVQKGLESGTYNTGVYVPEFEAGMYAFHQLLHKDLCQATDQS